MATPDKLQIMLDKQELHELVLTYCRAIDRQDFALVRTLYHDDAIDDHGDMFKGGPDAYVAWLPTIMRLWDATVHSLSNCLFKVDGDKAGGELYAVAYHRTHPPDAKEIVVGGRYLDRYEKRAGAWKFIHRSLVMDWCNVRAVNPDDYETFGAGAVRARHDAGDASYAELGMFGRMGE
jgi:ketosteroid isomerase-like protein